MLSWFRLSPYLDGAVGGVDITASNSDGGRYFVAGFIPTARSIVASSGAGESNVNDDSTRSASRCYMTGYKDRVRLESNTGRNYLWRRICFTFVGEEILLHTNPGDPSTFSLGTLWQLTSNGYERAITQIFPDAGGSSGSPVWTNLQEIMYKGVIAKDWNDPMTAKVDNSRVKVWSDTLTSLKALNDSGQQWIKNRWHPMHKTLLYNDDEQGGGKLPTELSVNNRQSMGDYYIIDIFDRGSAPDNSDVLNYSASGTMYWHER